MAAAGNCKGNPGVPGEVPPSGGGQKPYKIVNKRSSKRRGHTHRAYPPAVRLKAVRLHLEDGCTLAAVATELGVSRDVVHNWVRQYRADGEAGLQPKPRAPRAAKVASAIQAQVIELKQQHPSFGVQRIADTLKRWFFLGASPTTVRQTLHAAKLMDPPTPAKRRRNVTRPRFFERATPNQMWQSDICTFRLGGRNAYLIGFIDDCSRYITGLGLYRSQTAALVLEVYRRAIGEYGVPKEMLTDNGRQYASWRGNTAFQRELEKDQVKHIRSQPHHPMTLGKIERFWETMFQEFLARAQFDTFEEAQERLALWVKYYNHQRPHQGIGGLCPADRFFKVQAELKQVIERQVKENVLELALRGKPNKPFYMVGRLNDQTVMLVAEKGRVSMQLSESKNPNAAAPEGPAPTQEIVYDLRKETDHESEVESLDVSEVPAAAGAQHQQHGTSRGGAGGLDGDALDQHGGPGTGHSVASAANLARAGAGGYVGGLGTPSAGRRGAAPGPEPAAAQAAGQAGAAGPGGEGGEGRRGAAGGDEPAAGAGVPEPGGGDHQALTVTGGRHRATLDWIGEGGVSAAGRDHEGPRRPADGEGGGAAPWRLAQDLLRMGGAGAAGGDPGPAEPPAGPPADGGGPGEGAAAPRAGGPAGGRRGDDPGPAGHPGPAPADAAHHPDGADARQ